MPRLCIWPDGDWCYVEDREFDYGWKSDDYVVVTLPDNEEDADSFVERWNKSRIW